MDASTLPLYDLVEHSAYIDNMRESIEFDETKRAAGYKWDTVINGKEQSYFRFRMLNKDILIFDSFLTSYRKCAKEYFDSLEKAAA